MTTLPNPPRVIDLFCGAGGLSLGLHRAGFRTVLAVDNDLASVETFNRNFGKIAVCADLVTIQRFPRAEVVVGGPPCQGFSLLGKQIQRERHENELWRELMRCVKLARPHLFVIENVPEFFKAQAWIGVQEEAADLGYSLVSAVLNAADYGVPQRRRRAIVIGSRLGKPALPEPTHRNPDSLFPPGLPPWRTIREAIGDLPLQPNGMNRHDARNVGPLAMERYRHIPPGGNRRNLPVDLQPDCWRYKNPRSGGSADLMGRLTWDAPALTIRTQFLKPEKGRYLHPEAHRSLTVREGARLQTFPDGFEFIGSNFQAARQIGNAVPVELARQIGRALRAHLKESLPKHQPSARKRRRPRADAR